MAPVAQGQSSEASPELPCKAKGTDVREGVCGNVKGTQKDLSRGPGLSCTTDSGGLGRRWRSKDLSLA